MKNSHVTLLIKTVFLAAVLFIVPILRVQASITSPLDITGSNLKIWLDASDIDGDGNSGNDPANAALVSTWVDKSGNGKNATQATTGNKPAYSTNSLNSLPTISFSGGNKFLQSGVASDWNFLHNGTGSTVFIVAKATAPSFANFIISTDGRLGSHPGFSFGRCNGTACGPTSALVTYVANGGYPFPVEKYTAGTVAASSFAAWSIVQQATTPILKLFENGIYIDHQNSVANTSSTADAGYPLTIGSNPDDFLRYLTGNVAEVIIYDRALTAQERIDVQTYLQNKWAQPSTLSDSTAPTLSSFTSSTTNASYGVGQRINITANFNESLAAGSTMTVTLDTGAQVTLNTVSTSSLSGTYIVGAGQTSSDLTVASISSASISDLSDNTATSYSVPAAPNNIADTKSLVVDTSLPQVPFVIIAGQSNALGRADLSTISRTDGTSGTKILDQVLGTFQTLQQGVNQHYSNPTTEFGPEMGMAYLYKDEGSSSPLYILKYAIGNTQLAATSGGDWNSASSGEYFDTMITLAQGAFDYIHAAGYTPNFLGVVWMQGENDGVSSTNANLYQTNLTNFISAARSRLGFSTMPFVIGRIRQEDPSAPYASTVRTAEATVAAADTHACLVDTDDLTLKSDQVHFNAASQMTLGARFWDALKDCDHDTPSIVSGSATENAVSLTFSESLNSRVTTSTGQFTVLVNNVNDPISSVSVSGTGVTLQLSIPIYAGDSVLVSYGQPPVATALQDFARNSVPSFPITVTNNATTQHPARGHAFISSVSSYPIVTSTPVPDSSNTQTTDTSTPSVSVTTPGSNVTTVSSFVTPLHRGSKGDFVTELQQFLVGQNLLVMPVGVLYGYYGYLTKKAVQDFQSLHGVASAGDPGYGYFGPKTRAQANAMLAGQ